MNGSRYAAGSSRSRTAAPSRWVTQAAGEGWLIWAAIIDALVSLLSGVALAAGVLHYSLRDLVFVPAVFGCALAVSFADHVLGTVLLRGSIGKLMLGLRVVRATDGRRSGFWRAVGRWLLGFVYGIVMLFVEDGGGIGEAAGLRVVRRRDERQ